MRTPDDVHCPDTRDMPTVMVADESTPGANPSNQRQPTSCNPTAQQPPDDGTVEIGQGMTLNEVYEQTRIAQAQAARMPLHANPSAQQQHGHCSAKYPSAGGATSHADESQSASTANHDVMAAPHEPAIAEMANASQPAQCDNNSNCDSGQRNQPAALMRQPPPGMASSAPQTMPNAHQPFPPHHPCMHSPSGYLPYGAGQPPIGRPHANDPPNEPVAQKPSPPPTSPPSGLHAMQVPKAGLRQQGEPSTAQEHEAARPAHYFNLTGRN